MDKEDKLNKMLNQAENMDAMIDTIQAIMVEPIKYDVDSIEENTICEMYLCVIEGYMNRNRTISGEVFLKAVERLAKLKGFIDKKANFDDEDAIQFEI